MATVWLLVGDYYEVQEYDWDAPCRSKGHLLTLRDAQEHPDFQEGFEVFSRCWTPACFAGTQNIRGHIRIEAKTLPSADELVDILSDALNSEALLSKLGEIEGVEGLRRIWLTLR